MVDFILLTFFVLTFAAGYWTHKLFGSIGAATKRAYTWAGSLFD